MAQERAVTVEERGKMIKARIRENVIIMERKVIWLKTVSEGRILASTVERPDTFLKSA